MSPPGTSSLHELADEECWTLAASQPLGRLAWMTSNGPTVIPVNFVITDREVHVRTEAYSALARECDDSNVAFEVDHFDPDSRSGWSVLMRGRAHLRFDGSHDADDQLDVWPSGSHVLRVAIAAHEISGRRIA
jgi:uncharacterized protein